MPLAGFEPAIPASEWPPTHALDRAAIGSAIRHVLLVFRVCLYFYNFIGMQMTTRGPNMLP